MRFLAFPLVNYHVKSFGLLLLVVLNLTLIRNSGTVLYNHGFKSLVFLFYFVSLSISAAATGRSSVKPLYFWLNAWDRIKYTHKM